MIRMHEMPFFSIILDQRPNKHSIYADFQFIRDCMVLGEFKFFVKPEP